MLSLGVDEEKSKIFAYWNHCHALSLKWNHTYKHLGLRKRIFV